MRCGFPPAIILKNDRKKYHEALHQANGGNYQKLTLLMCQSLERTFNIYINALPGNDEEYVEISNLAQEPNTPYGQEYISLLARTGKIDAYKEGRNWLTNREAVEVTWQPEKKTLTPISVFLYPILTQSSILFYQK